MILRKKLVVVMPAYNAEQTLEKTYKDLPFEYIDDVILVDDASRDKTTELAGKLGLSFEKFPFNQGYGANQKTCYQLALEKNADIVVMLHPDYQYDPKLITAMAGMIASGIYDVVLGSRILGANTLKGGMPLYKYLANRLLTFVQNLFLGAKLSEYHTGYRAFDKKVLVNLPLAANGDDFVFDNQMLTQAIYFNYRIGEISCPTKYFPEASSINFARSVEYGIGVLWTTTQFVLERLGILHFEIFSKKTSENSFLFLKDYSSNTDSPSAGT